MREGAMESMELTELAPKDQDRAHLGSTMVTGATGGLGRHLAHALAAMHCEPVLVLRARDQKCPTGLPEKAREIIRDVTDLEGMKLVTRA